MDFRRLFSNYTPIQPEQTPDDATREGVFNYDLENKKHDIAFKKSYLKTRKWVGFWTFLLVWVWLASMLFFVLCKGTRMIPGTCYGFDLPDGVIIALVTTTTVTVVAFLTIVIKDLFPKGSGNGDMGPQ
jgi:hypothetical protein